MTRPIIPDSEFKERARRLQKLMERDGIDILLAFGNEAEPQFARYLCDYWPSFETTGVLLAQKGDPILLIGPESYTFAKDRSRIPQIRRLAAFRESSNPEYPGEKLETFSEVIEELGVISPKRFAIAGFNLIPYVTEMELRESLRVFGDVETVRGDEIMMELRMVKSENELACLRYAGQITAKAFRDTLDRIEPGMTELQVRGIACESIYRNGGENESYIEIDNYKGGQIAADHLVECGYRHFAFIGGSENSQSNGIRISGYCDRLREHGMTIDADHILYGGFSLASGYTMANHLFGKYPDVDGIFCGNDVIALGVLQFLMGNNKRIPEDVGVIGFDDILIAGLPQIQMTTVAQPRNQMGKLAAEMLIDQIQNKDITEHHIMLEPKLVVRRSTRK